MEVEAAPPRGDMSSAVVQHASLEEDGREAAAQDIEDGVRRESLSLLKVIGAGGFGKVFLGFDEDRKKVCAVKIMRKGAAGNVEFTAANEIRALRRAQGLPFVVDLLGTVVTSTHIYIATEFCAGGELLYYLDRCAPLTVPETRFFAAEVALALEGLHNEGVFYGDLKPENIVVDHNGHVRLIDFGLSRIRPGNLPANARWEFPFASGSLEYAAPELMRRLPVGLEADWWALGILVFELLMGNSPFFVAGDMDVQRLCDRICRTNLNFAGLGALLESPEAESFVSQLLCKDPADRLGRNSGSEVLDHPFLAGLDWQAVGSRELPPPFAPDLRGPVDVRYFSDEFTSDGMALP